MSSGTRTPAVLSSMVLAGTALTSAGTGQAAAATSATTLAAPVAACSTPYQNDWRLGPDPLPTELPLLATMVKGYERTGTGSPSPEVFLKEWTTPDGGWKMPPNDGFDGIRNAVELQQNEKWDRFGSPDGSYLAPTGTPYAERSLHPKSLKTYPKDAVCNYHTYVVIKPFRVFKGPAAPWFGQPGGGQQIKLDHRADPRYPEGGKAGVAWLLDHGFVRETTTGAVKEEQGAVASAGEAGGGAP
ncbi:TNT domain-containing protein [Streptomyces sp. NPDC002506]|uniref:TNT domain-containing protein n=1 Tax=Streptomyces sp. NPDC002506 TaxID=3154536 RepID=UPI00331E76BD